ncbi:MAG: hypothetical protein K2K64_04535, partial [Muribaculaceae bacterium]|nr:hypothetical protein [Muribaculaceae bacterium]
MEGTQQSGLAFNLRVADLARDGQILTRAREAALAVLRGNVSLLAPGCTPTAPRQGDLPPIALQAEEVAVMAGELSRRFAKTIDWSQIS